MKRKSVNPDGILTVAVEVVPLWTRTHLQKTKAEHPRARKNELSVSGDIQDLSETQHAQHQTAGSTFILKFVGWTQVGSIVLTSSLNGGERAISDEWSIYCELAPNSVYKNVKGWNHLQIQLLRLNNNLRKWIGWDLMVTCFPICFPFPRVFWK